MSNNSMGLHVETWNIDAMLKVLPAEHRYDWSKVSEQIEAAGFNRADFLWYCHRHPQKEFLEHVTKIVEHQEKRT